MADTPNEHVGPGGGTTATGMYLPDPTPDPAGDPTRVTPADLPAVPGYEVTGLIAVGGMGRVLAARDLGFDREVAIKTVRPGSGAAHAARFAREILITGRLVHPNIPPVYALGKLADGLPFLVMKRVGGQTLAAQLDARPDVGHDRPRFVGVFEAVCQAVGYAHSRGVIHRDLKPANVMVGDHGEVQVMDWGLARDQGEPADPAGPAGPIDPTGPPSLTRTGELLGTPAYLAPEQARGAAVDARADVFALGGILCEVLTGRPPHDQGGCFDRVFQAGMGDVADAFARLDGCGADAELVALCKRCLAPAAADRPADGTAVAREVAAYREGVEARLRAVERDRAAAAARAVEQRKKARVVFLTVLAGVCAVAVVSLKWQATESDRRADALTRANEDEQRRRDEEFRLAREAGAVAGLLERAAAALAVEDADRAEPLIAQADQRAVAAGGTLSSRAALARADLAFLQTLDSIDDDRWTPNESQLPPRAVIVDRWRAAFAGYGIVPGTTPTAEAADRVNRSGVRSAVLAALHGWMIRTPEPEAGAVRAILDAADPDPFRVEVRGLLVSPGGGGLVALAGRPEWAADPPQPAGLVRAVGASPRVPEADRRALLTRAADRRPDDFRLAMEAGSEYPNTPAAWPDRLRWYQAAVGLRSRNVAARLDLGLALYDRGDAAAAAAAFREVVRLAPGFALGHNNLAKALGDLGDWRAAAAACRAAIAADPRFAPAHANLATALSRQNDWLGALAAAEAAVAADPEFANGHYNLGLARHAFGEYAAAEAAYRAALRIDPTNAQYLTELANAVRDLDRLDEAEDAYRQAIAIDPRYAPARNNLGTLLLKQGNPAAAAAEFRAAIDLSPANPVYRTNLGIARRDLGDRPGAIASFADAIMLNLRYAPARYNLGRAFEAAGNAAGAVGEIAAAARIDRVYLPSLNQLGGRLLRRDDPAGAAAAFREAVAIDPGYGIARFNLGMVLAGTGQPAAAAEELRVAVRLGVRHARACYYLGRSLWLTGDWPGAEEAFAEAIRLDPADAGHHQGLGMVLASRRELDGALAALREAVRLDPKDAGVRNDLGFVYEKRLELDEAAAAYATAARLDPRFAVAHANLGDVCRKQGRHADAVAAYDRALAVQPNFGYARAGGAYCERALRGEVPTAPPPRPVTP